MPSGLTLTRMLSSMARGAKSKANLRRGGGQSPGRRKKDDPGRKFAIQLLCRPKFLDALKAKMDDCSIHPSVLNNLLYYAHGKPPDLIQTQQIVPVRIVHQYADDTEKDDAKNA
jgi:hypothetical protein